MPVSSQKMPLFNFDEYIILQLLPPTHELLVKDGLASNSQFETKQARFDYLA